MKAVPVKVCVEAMARTIYKREIPPKLYEGMKLLNKGAGVMSLVFEKDDKTVRVFTRDEIKVEWLCQRWGLGIGEQVDIVETPSSKYDQDIYVIDMPKLYPLSAENRKVAKNITAAIDSVYSSFRQKPQRNYYTLRAALDSPILKGKRKEKTIIKELMDFVANYNDNQYGLDIAPRQFSQTKRGKLVLRDPLVDINLVKMMRQAQSLRNRW